MGGRLLILDGHAHKVRRVEPPTVTTPTVPSAPIAFTATAAAQGAVLTWVPPSNGGSPLTGYRLYVAPIGGVFDIASDQSAIAVSNLSPDISHTFTLTAVNAVGQGPGAVSGPVQPFVGTLYSPFSSYDKLVIQQYRDFLGRSPTSTELATERQRLIGHEDSPESLIDRLAHGVRFGDTYGPVARLYFAYFLRAPDLGGLDHWRERYRTGTSLAAISQAFASSSEFQTRYGAMSNRQFVETVYLNVLGRPGNESGIAYWTGQLNAGKKTRGAVMTGFSESSEYIRVRKHEIDAILIYRGMLGRVPTKAEFASHRRPPRRQQQTRSCTSSPTSSSSPSTRRAPTSDRPTSGSAAGDLGLQGLQPLGELGLAERPDLGLELEVDRLVVAIDLGDGGQRRLGPAGQLPRDARGPAGQGGGIGRQRIVVDAAPRQAAALGLRPVEHLAEQHRGRRGLRAGDALEHPGVAAAGVDAELEEPGVEPGPPGGEPQVAGQREVHAGADRGAVHGGDRRQGAAGDPEEALVDVTQALLLRGRRGGTGRRPHRTPAGRR